MAENEKVLQPEVEQPEQPEKKKKSGGGVKEFFRKQTVNLKRKPQNIPFVFYIIACIVYLVELTNFSKCLMMNLRAAQNWSALCVFGCTLFSLLVIVSYMRIFPKYKKPSIAMMVVTGVFTAALIFFDVVFYVEVTGLIEDYGAGQYPDANSAALATSIVHIVFLAIGAILLATMPLWKKALMKINTRKEVESAAGNVGEIDLQDAD